MIKREFQCLNGCKHDNEMPIIGTVSGMNSRATQLKFVSPGMSHYASHYHYGSQSIAYSGQWEC